MHRLGFTALVCGCLLLWGTASASAQPDLHGQVAGPEWVQTPLVQFSLVMHYGPYDPAPGAAALAGIAWEVVGQPLGAEPAGPVIQGWNYGEALNFTPPDDYWIERAAASFQLPDREGRYDLSVDFKAYDSNGSDIGSTGGFGYQVTLDETPPLTIAPWPASCKRGARVTLRFLLIDNLSPHVRASIVIQKNGQVVKALSCGLQPIYHGRFSPTPRRSFECRLPKGRYRFSVAGTDRAGNVATKLGANILTVH